VEAANLPMLDRWNKVKETYFTCKRDLFCKVKEIYYTIVEAVNLPILDRWNKAGRSPASSTA
jgi:hypothetical protein